MDQNKTKQATQSELLSSEFMEKLELDLDFIIREDNRKRAHEFYVLLDKALKKNWALIKETGEIRKFYEKALIKARFLALPIISDAEVISLIKNNFTWQFRIDGYSLIDKFKYKLINIEVYEDRDAFKEEIKSALFISQEVITSRSQIKTIEGWLKDYNAKLGLGPVPNIQRIQYFTDLEKIKELNDNDREKLRVLFDFYERLKFSSLSPEGHEEDTPVVIDGGFYVFNQGILEPLDEIAKKARQVTGPPKTVEEKKIEELQAVEERLADDSLEKKVIDEAGIQAQRRIEDLKILANKYKEGTLERKAIEEEVRKLEVGSKK